MRTNSTATRNVSRNWSPTINACGSSMWTRKPDCGKRVLERRRPNRLATVRPTLHGRETGVRHQGCLTPLRALDRVALRAERQRANALAARRENRVRDRGRGRRERGLAATGGRIVRLEEVHLDLGRLVDADERILVEVALLRAALLERDPEAHRRAQAVDHRALALVLGAAHVDHGADVGRDPDLVDLDLLALDTHVRDLGKVSRVAEVE